jgi:hemerythrin-like domain-containing protein
VTTSRKILLSKAIEDLMHEHEAILSSLKILDKISTDIENGSIPAKADLKDFIGFLREFADKCHHGKEEGLLFPALIKAGMPGQGGPIGVMLLEHVQGRGYVKEMSQALESGPDLKVFADAAAHYSSLLQSHIQKENSVLFPIAEKTLDKERLDQLYRSFEEHEERIIGHGRHEELHQMLKELQSKYLK